MLSVVLAASVDSLGYVPTFRKSYLKPNDEPALTYTFAIVSCAFAIAALQTYSFVTLFYLLVFIAANTSLVSFLLMRRKSLATIGKK